MKKVNVIINRSTSGLGIAGSLIKVAAGYARNFLFPNMIAVPATKANMQSFEARKNELDSEHKKNLEKAKKVRDEIDSLAISITRPSHMDGKLFGSVKISDIADAIKSKSGVEIGLRDIKMNNSIKSTGKYKVLIDLYYEISATINLSVVSKEKEEEKEGENREFSDVGGSEDGENNQYDEDSSGS